MRKQTINNSITSLTFRKLRLRRRRAHHLYNQQWRYTSSTWTGEENIILRDCRIYIGNFSFGTTYRTRYTLSSAFCQKHREFPNPLLDWGKKYRSIVSRKRRSTDKQVSLWTMFGSALPFGMVASREQAFTGPSTEACEVLCQLNSAPRTGRQHANRSSTTLAHAVSVYSRYQLHVPMPLAETQLHQLKRYSVRRHRQIALLVGKVDAARKHINRRFCTLLLTLNTWKPTPGIVFAV